MTRVSLPVANNAKPTNRRSIFDVLGVNNEGASPRGSTYYKTLLACPREFALRYVLGYSPEVISEALTTGWLWHHCLELYYNKLKAGADRRDALAAAYEPVDLVEQEQGYGDMGATVRRMLDGYFDEFDGEKIRVIAVEETLFYKGAFDYSARLDLIIEDLSKGGMWVMEHKSARSITADLLDNYQMDLQILGQVWLLESCVDLSQYPRFQGVRVNIATKHKTPQYARLDVCPSRYHLEAFTRALGQWSVLMQRAAELGWPQALGHCAGFNRGYSRCQMFEICHGHPEMTVEDWAAQDDPPHGYQQESTK